jgi:threonylcarbamoyladenosine tRNA methylthiotransferase MtaB
LEEIIKVAFTTFGCKVNQAETDALAAKLAEYGAELAKRPEEADILIVNTCAVTENAQREGEKYLLRLKRRFSALKIVATGCTAELRRDELLEHGADIVIPNASKNDTLDIVLQKALPVTDSVEKLHTRAFLKIQDGCDCFCTYCIIPSLRGAPVSVPLEDVIAEVRRLVHVGYKEIILTGIHIGLYGVGCQTSDQRERISTMELQHGRTLVHLLENLVKLEGEFRLRLTSLYVQDLTEPLINLLAEYPDRLCPHVHISLQSGSAKILAAMGRKYTPEEFVSATERLRKKLPLVNIGADLIVGFPGESDEDFVDTVELLERACLDYLHVFPYSMRPGTPAADFSGQISDKVKQARVNIARELDLRFRKAGAARLKGKTLRVLSEKGGKGHADNYYMVELPPDTPPNEFMEVEY